MSKHEFAAYISHMPAEKTAKDNQSFPDKVVNGINKWMMRACLASTAGGVVIGSAGVLLRQPAVLKEGEILVITSASGISMNLLIRGYSKASEFIHHIGRDDMHERKPIYLVSPKIQQESTFLRKRARKKEHILFNNKV